VGNSYKEAQSIAEKTFKPKQAAAAALKAAEEVKLLCQSVKIYTDVSFSLPKKKLMMKTKMTITPSWVTLSASNLQEGLLANSHTHSLLHHYKQSKLSPLLLASFWLQYSL